MTTKRWRCCSWIKVHRLMLLQRLGWVLKKKKVHEKLTLVWMYCISITVYIFFLSSVLEWLHSSPHCSQKEPDKHCFSATAVWSRDQCFNETGSQPSASGSSGRTCRDGQPPAGKRSPCEHSDKGHTEAQSLWHFYLWFEVETRNTCTLHTAV